MLQVDTSSTDTTGRRTTRSSLRQKPRKGAITRFLVPIRRSRMAGTRKLIIVLNTISSSSSSNNLRYHSRSMRAMLQRHSLDHRYTNRNVKLRPSLSTNPNLNADRTRFPILRASTFHGGLYRSGNLRSSYNLLSNEPTRLRRYRACLSRTAHGHKTYLNRLAPRLVFHLYRNMASMEMQASRCRHQLSVRRLHLLG